MRHANRIAPLMPSQSYKTYEVAAPLRTHWRQATCEEAGCEAWRVGWLTVIDERTPGATTLAERQAYYIRHQSGRAFIESLDPSGHTVFDFAPGQTCFDRHNVKTDRPLVYLVKPGDHRGGVGPTRTHQRPDDWLEDFTEHQDIIATEIGKG